MVFAGSPVRRVQGDVGAVGRLACAVGEIAAAGTLVVVVALGAWSTLGSGSSSTAQAGTAGPATRMATGVTAAEAAATAAATSPTVAASTSDVEAARVELQRRLGALASLGAATYRQIRPEVPAHIDGLLDRERGGQYGSLGLEALQRRVDDARSELDRAEQEQQREVAAFFEAVAADARRAAVAKAEADGRVNSASNTTSSASNATSRSGSCAGDLACFLPCTRAHESDTAGGYSAVSPDGVYRGAYQFDRTTWNSVATSTGHDELVGVDPAAAAPSAQDELASALYLMRGNQPWGGRC
jgi:hypothetical protein